MKNKFQKIVISFIILTSVFFVVKDVFEDYFAQKNNYGRAFNKYRRQMQIPLVENDWHDIDNRKLFWKDTTKKHFFKMISINSKYLNLEIDKFLLNNDSILVISNTYNRLTKKIVHKESWIESNK